MFKVCESFFIFVLIFAVLLVPYKVVCPKDKNKGNLKLCGKLISIDTNRNMVSFFIKNKYVKGTFNFQVDDELLQELKGKEENSYCFEINTPELDNKRIYYILNIWE